MGIQAGRAGRNSNIELLRIIAMAMIVFHHFAVHGGFSFDNHIISLPRLWILFIRMGGKVGVDVFVLISGYCLIGSDQKIFDFRKALKFWGQVFFYSAGIYFLFGALDRTKFTAKSFLGAVFPITFSTYWFASAYFILYLLHPFLNQFLRGLQKGAYQKVLLLLFTCWCLIPTFTSSSYQGNSLLWFMCLYSLAGYIRLFGLNPRIKCRHYFAGWILFSLFTYLLAAAFCVWGRRYPIFARQSAYFFGAEKLPILCISVSLFMAFETLKMKNRAWINLLASAMFGVYLIHDNRLVRHFLWIDLFQNAVYQESAFVIVYSLLAAVAVYFVCAFIELLRARTVERLYLWIVDKYLVRILEAFARKCLAAFQRILGN